MVVQVDAGESCDGQSSREPIWVQWYKCAVGVDDAVEPSVRDFKSKKSASWLQYAVNFGEGAILQLGRPQMMQDKDGSR